ncbi:hypothetical protein [Archangium sp.]|uniref:hypothetical protein n=1 Tax=Archangium sp. TaxID=1872627 RepID=UPI00389B0F76
MYASTRRLPPHLTQANTSPATVLRSSPAKVSWRRPLLPPLLPRPCLWRHARLLCSSLGARHAPLLLTCLGEWHRPNDMTLTILDTPKRALRMRIWCVPVDATHTRMMLASSRDFLRYNPFAPLLNRFNKVIVREDKAGVESSYPVEVPPAGEERGVATDRATLAFRRWYLERKKGGGREASRTETAPLAG